MSIVFFLPSAEQERSVTDDDVDFPCSKTEALEVFDGYVIMYEMRGVPDSPTGT